MYVHVCAVRVDNLQSTTWLPVLCVTVTAAVEGSTLLEEEEDVGGWGRMCVMCFGLRPRLPPLGAPTTG